MDARQWVRALLLFRLFERCVSYSRHTTQKVYPHDHHPNDHYHHNSHHTTCLPTPLSQTNQAQRRRKEEESSFTDLSHISCVLK